MSREQPRVATRFFVRRAGSAAFAKQVAIPKDAPVHWATTLWAGALASLAITAVGAIAGRAAPYPYSWLFGAIAFAIVRDEGGTFGDASLAGFSAALGGVIFAEFGHVAPVALAFCFALLIALPFIRGDGPALPRLIDAIATLGAALLAIAVLAAFDAHRPLEVVLPPAGAQAASWAAVGLVVSIRGLPRVLFPLFCRR